MNSINEKIPFLRVLPDGWKTHRLKEISKVNLSNVDKKSHDGEKVVKLCNYVDVYYNHTISDKIDFMIATASDEQIRKLTLKKDDVILTKDSESPSDIGIPTWVKEDMPEVVCGYHLALIRPNVNVVTGLYLYYLLYSYGFKEHFWISAKGVTRFGISKGDIQNIQLLIPPIELQNKITRYLKEKDLLIDKLIKKKENLIMLLQQQRQSIITEAVTKGLNQNVKMKDSGVEWIGEIPEHWALNKIKYCVNLRGEKAEEQTTLQYLGLENIESKTGRYIPTEDVEIDGSAIKFFKGNVLFGKLRPYLTKVLLAEFNGRCSTEILVLETLSSIINNAYLKNLLLTPNFIDEINSSTYGSKMPRANWSFIGNTLIPLPPLSEQEVIVKEIMEVDERYFILISKLKNQIKKLKEYRQSLIYEAVTGKIDVRDMELDEVR